MVRLRPFGFERPSWADIALTERNLEMYRIFYTDVPLPKGMSEPIFDKLMPRAESTEGEALNHAMRRLDDGASVWLIKKPDGDVISRSEISAEYYRRNLRWPTESKTRNPA